MKKSRIEPDNTNECLDFIMKLVFDGRKLLALQIKRSEFINAFLPLKTVVF